MSKDYIGLNVGAFDPSEYISNALSDKFPLRYSLIYHSPELAILGTDECTWNVLVNELGSNDRWLLMVPTGITALRRWLAFQSNIGSGPEFEQITTECVRHVHAVKVSK